MKVFFALLLLLGFNKTIAQQAIIRGVVSIFNSEIYTGKRQYVSNAQIEDDFNKAQPTTTDYIGQFKLTYVGVKEKTSISFTVKRYGLEVVNKDALKAICGQADLVKISMAIPDSITEYRKRIYNIGKTEAEKSLEKELKKKEKQLSELKIKNKKDGQLIKQLQNEIISLIEQKQKISDLAEELARKYAPINLDDATPIFSKAFFLFQNGHLDSALKILSQSDLSKRVSRILIKQENNKREQEEIQNDSKNTQDALRLKIDLHKTKYEYDSVIESFDLLIKLDTFNTGVLSEYGLYLYESQKFKKAIQIYRKEIALAKYVSTFQTNQDEIIKGLATAYSNLGLCYMDNGEFDSSLNSFSTSLDYYYKLSEKQPKKFNSEIARVLRSLGNVLKIMNNPDGESTYLKSLYIVEDLCKDDSVKYLPLFAETLNDFGSYCRIFDKLGKADSLFSESITIWERLVKTNQTYETGLAMTQSNLANLYSLQGFDEKAEPLYQNALIIRRKLVKMNPIKYKDDLALTLSGLCVCLRKLHKFKSAKESCKECLDIYEDLNKRSDGAFEPHIARTKLNFGMYYSEVNNLDSSLFLLTESLFIFQTLSAKSPSIYNNMLSLTTEQLLLLFVKIIYWKGIDNFIINDRKKFELLEDQIVTQAKTDSYLTHLLEKLYGLYIFDLLPASQFISAEKSTKHAIELFPEEYMFKVALAHSLLFQEKYNECRQIYGELKQVKNALGKSLVEQCLNDLDQLEKMGLKSKYMNQVRNFLRER